MGRTNGSAVYWNPEGYRAVKHVLVKFDDEQSALYSQLQSTLSSLNAEKDAILNPAETEEGEEICKIDYQLVTPGLAKAFKAAGIWEEQRHGIYLSDHYPVWAIYED